MYTELFLLASCMVQRPGASTRSRSDYFGHFHERCLRSITGIKWQGYESNEDVLKRQPAQHRTCFVSGSAVLGWPHTKDGRQKCMPKEVFFFSLHSQSTGRPLLVLQETRSKKKGVIVIHQESAAKTNWRCSLHRQEPTINLGCSRPQAEMVGACKWERPVVRLRLRGTKAAKQSCRRQEQTTSQSSSAQVFACARCNRVHT